MLIQGGLLDLTDHGSVDYGSTNRAIYTAKCYDATARLKLTMFIAYTHNNVCCPVVAAWGHTHWGSGARLHAASLTHELEASIDY